MESSRALPSAADRPALVLGYGSIGRVHARILDGLASALVIVEASDAGRARARSEHPAAVVVDRLAALDGAAVAWSPALAVIATWGPSHASLFHALVDRGVRHILCEKPLASSVALADAMVRRAAADGVFLASHHYLRYSGFVTALRRLSDAHREGEPVSVAVHGGAACLVTNGLHWIDFAIQLFGSPPRRVVGTAQGEAINPRSPDLHLYGGSAVWTFDGGRELTLLFGKGSSVYPTTSVYYRDAVATVDYDYEVVLARRDPEAVRKFPAITRTGPAAQVVFKGPLPGVLPADEALCLGLKELWEGKADMCPAAAASAAVNACIASLVAGREGRGIDLPIDSGSAWGREAWPIS